MLQQRSYYCILGGNDPGIYDARPNLPTHTTGIFPLVVKCTTHQEAEDVYTFQKVVERLDPIQDTGVILASLIQSEEGAAVLRNSTKFYGVLVGMPTGIYLDFKDLQWLFSTRITRNFKRLDTFIDAVTYLSTDGQFTTATAFLNNYQEQLVDPGTAGGLGNIPVHDTSYSQPSPPTEHSRTIHAAATDSVGSVAQQTTLAPTPAPSVTPAPSITPVYQHIRSLGGIITSIAQRPAVHSADHLEIAALGPAANKYLSAHGYNVSAIHHIDHAASTSSDLVDFISYLHPRGMAWTEITYLWDLIHAHK